MKLISILAAVVASATLAPAQTVSVWLTTQNLSQRMQPQSSLTFAAGTDGINPVIVDETQTYQEIEGFGASFTDSAAYLLNQVATATARSNAMNNLFTRNGSGIGVSFIRNPMAASDLARTHYSYDDLPPGQTDVNLTNFSIAHDQVDIIPLVQQALQLNPQLKIMATPWSPPGWMKTSGSMIGGALTNTMYAPFARYFVKYIQAYAAAGIPTHYLSLQNEPLYVPGDYPGMYMDASNQIIVLRDYVLPTFVASNITTRVLVYDHNWDQYGYPQTVFGDATLLASTQVAGTAWHGYGGTPGVMLTLANQFPAKGNYQTEHSGGTWVGDQMREDFAEIIHVMRCWGKAYVKWSMAQDQDYNPNLGGCNTCIGLVTVNSSSGAVTYNTDFYTLGHFSKFVLPGATRIYSANANGLVSAAFKNPDGSKALVAFNDTTSSKTFQVQWGGKSFSYTLASYAGATFTWSGTQTGTNTVKPANKVQGSSFNSQSGIQTEWTSDSVGGYNLGYCDNNDYAVYRNVDFGTGFSNVTARVASFAGGSVEFRLNSPTGTRIAALTMPNTGSWQTFQNVSGAVSNAFGLHDLYLVFKGGNSVANFNWFQFGGALSDGAAHLIPGAIQAEDYDLGGEGVAYHDSDTGNTGNAYRPSEGVDIEAGTGANGHNVGWIETNEWLRFTVNVSTTATYRVRYAVASAQSGPFTMRLLVDGQAADLVNFNGTGGWQNWMNVYSPTPFSLSNGTHSVRLEFLSQEFNVDEFEFVLHQTETNVPPYKDPNEPLAVRLDDLMARLSLDEKIGQMCQVSKGFLSSASDVRDFRLGSLLSGGGEAPGVNTPEAWANMIDAYQAMALSTPLGIPILYAVDAVHGHNNLYGATLFPHNIGMGATRNPDLMKRAAEVTAVEAAATGVHWTFAPTIAVARNESWGRFYESLSELSALVGQMGAAAIQGYQGTNLASVSNIIACAKHFAGDGGTTNGTDQGNTVLDEATFRSIHIAPYEEAIAAGVKTIMVSYSSWNGVKMHGHTNLLSTVLKGELGFEGFLISDWAGVNQIDSNYSNAVVKSVNAGMDMVMVPDQYQNFLNILKGAVLAGRVSTNRIDDAVRRILKVKFESGLFERPYARRELLPAVGSAAHRAVARQAVQESLVILKNDGGLVPLPKNLARIHVAGKNANNLGNQCGGWSISWQGSSGATTLGTTIFQGITNTVSAGTSVTFSLDGTGAAGANVGIVVVGETPYAEGAGDNSNLFLSASDLSAINNVRNAGVPVIVILVSGRPMYVESGLPNWNCFIAAWLPGTEGQGVADILFGNVTPTGVLSHSWPRDAAIPVNVGDPNYNPLFPVPPLAPPTSMTNYVVGITDNGGGTFTLQFAGTTGVDYHVQSTMNLHPPILWEPVTGSTNTVTNASGVWSHTISNQGPQRFYRSAVVIP